MTNSSGRSPEGDEQLLQDISRVLPVADPMPDHVAAAARAALTMRTIDAELAELLSDSAAEPTLAAARSHRPVRLLSFATVGGEVEVEMQVETVGDRRNIVGQLLGAASGSLTLDSAAGSTEVSLDEAGLFTVREIVDGLIRLRCTSTQGRPVATSWVLL